MSGKSMFQTNKVGQTGLEADRHEF